uniref:Uncharacterized protein n=1 Tax=Alexandrium monilatum TaxID=311494 RepID=A0A7S4QVD0_9DINO
MKGENAPAGTARRANRGPLLTLIPEGERTIDHRLQLILVGQGAQSLAERVAASEFNESYRPRKPSFRAQHGPSTPTGSSSGQLEVALDERRPSARSLGDTDVRSEDLVLFCPADSFGYSLVRVRLCVVEGFAASLPRVVDAAVARDSCVTIIHWRPGDGIPPPEQTSSKSKTCMGAESVKDTISEFNMRVAEMTHGMTYLPLVFLMSINEQKEESKKLQEVVSQRTLKDGSTPRTVVVEDDAEETILDAIQELVGMVIRERARPMALEASVAESLLPEHKKSKARCCALS